MEVRVVLGKAVKLGVCVQRTVGSTCFTLFYKQTYNFSHPIKRKRNTGGFWGLISKAHWHISALFMVCGCNWCSLQEFACSISVFTAHIKTCRVQEYNMWADVTLMDKTLIWEKKNLISFFFGVVKSLHSVWKGNWWGLRGKLWMTEWPRGLVTNLNRETERPPVTLGAEQQHYRHSIL